MPVGLLAYSASNNLNRYASKDVSVRVTQVENGYIFHLSGDSYKPPKRGKKGFILEDGWTHFTADFVYPKLEDGLKEMQDFFKLIKKRVTKK